MTERLVNRILVDNLKAGPCPRCGVQYAPDQMDFDHVRGVKRANISDLMDAPLPVLVEELAKCDPTCSNCHRGDTRDRRLDLHVDAAYDADLDAELAREAATEKVG